RATTKWTPTNVPKKKKSLTGSPSGWKLRTPSSIGWKFANNLQSSRISSLCPGSKKTCPAPRKNKSVYLLEIEPLDLGTDVRAMGLELTEADENREPIRGADAARIWSRVLRATAANETWALDFFIHLDRVRGYCQPHQIAFRAASSRSIVICAPELAALEPLIDRFQSETFGVRAGEKVATGDAALEGELARRG